MAAYYNEHDSFAAAWLRELMKEKLIADGEVDERSIEDVRPEELKAFTQCHFFAGIGIWPAALRAAGWRDDRAVWTGSCPCQPFSAAGKGSGFADERHLWPAFYHLLEQCRPDVVLGEQVASKDGLAWLDLVSADMEAARYAFGAVDTCAAGFGAPHIRQRLYFGAKRLADTGSEDQSGRGILGPGQSDGASAGTACERSAGLRADGGLADTDEGQRGRLADGEGCERVGAPPRRIKGHGIAKSGGDVCDHGRPGPVNGLWRNADWLFCRDGKWRPVESGTFPLADAGTYRNRVAELRGAGNAINLAQATGFIEAFEESIR